VGAGVSGDPRECSVVSGREPVLLDVKLKYESTAEFDSGFAANVAANVVFLKTPNPKTVGTPVTMQLRLRNGTPVLRGEGRVLWSYRAPAVPAGHQNGMGIEFVAADPASAERVQQIVAAHGAGANAMLPGVRLLQMIAAAPAEPGATPRAVDGEAPTQPPPLVLVPRQQSAEPADDIGSAFDAIRSDMAIPISLGGRGMAPPAIATRQAMAPAALAAADDGPTELDATDIEELSDEDVSLIEAAAEPPPTPAPPVAPPAPVETALAPVESAISAIEPTAPAPVPPALTAQPAAEPSLHGLVDDLDSALDALTGPGATPDAPPEPPVFPATAVTPPIVFAPAAAIEALAAPEQQSATPVIPDALAIPNLVALPEVLATPDLPAVPDLLAVPEVLAVPDALAVPVVPVAIATPVMREVADALVDAAFAALAEPQVGAPTPFEVTPTPPPRVDAATADGSGPALDKVVPPSDEWAQLVSGLDGAVPLATEIRASSVPATPQAPLEQPPDMVAEALSHDDGEIPGWDLAVTAPDAPIALARQESALPPKPALVLGASIAVATNAPAAVEVGLPAIDAAPAVVAETELHGRLAALPCPGGAATPTLRARFWVVGGPLSEPVPARDFAWPEAATRRPVFDLPQAFNEYIWTRLTQQMPEQRDDAAPTAGLFASAPAAVETPPLVDLGIPLRSIAAEQKYVEEQYGRSYEDLPIQAPATTPAAPAATTSAFADDVFASSDEHELPLEKIAVLAGAVETPAAEPPVTAASYDVTPPEVLSWTEEVFSSNDLAAQQADAGLRPYQPSAIRTQEARSFMAHPPAADVALTDDAAMARAETDLTPQLDLAAPMPAGQTKPEDDIPAVVVGVALLDSGGAPAIPAAVDLPPAPVTSDEQTAEPGVGAEATGDGDQQSGSVLSFFKKKLLGSNE